ncbi:MAG TPA: hypothetical protein VGH07_08325, partial [Chthoniobacterales bacterium]
MKSTVIPNKNTPSLADIFAHDHFLRSTRRNPHESYVPLRRRLSDKSGPDRIEYPEINLPARIFRYFTRSRVIEAAGQRLKPRTVTRSGYRSAEVSADDSHILPKKRQRPDNIGHCKLTILPVSYRLLFAEAIEVYRQIHRKVLDGFDEIREIRPPITRYDRMQPEGVLLAFTLPR